MALTGKKQKFADAVLAGLSNRNAAIKAGYSAATASAAGSRLVKDTDVVAYLARKRKEAKKSTPSTIKKPSAAATSTGGDETDPLKFLEGVMSGRIEANLTQVRAATAMLPFRHPKLGEGGKKDQKQEAAKTASKGRFASAAAPRLVHSK